jgi:hypothetical protein
MPVVSYPEGPACRQRSGATTAPEAAAPFCRCRTAAFRSAPRTAAVRPIRRGVGDADRLL